MAEPPDNVTTQALCPHCIKPVEPLDHFCPHCAKPITTHAATDPLGQVYATGSLYRIAADHKKPNRFLLVGMWALCLPMLFAPATGGLGLLLAVIYFVMLWKVTANYLRARKTDTSLPAEIPADTYDALTAEALSYPFEGAEATTASEPDPPKRMDPLVVLGLIMLIAILVMLSLLMIGPTFFPPG
ncbi:zinc ribbon domain-containing protein [Mucisphaera calidilacus]|uniref:Uncharacterized protein n=1 Tax=Mucisphaera calidilacus TaxID=2527982 RepID=A0A518C0V3_9BACT|nr:hypothetical protein [Mucisphaera calidilacus]QDU72857.1 hypothetical protein Pan265_27330 [Mucisphaera calidilacus]